MEGGSFYFIVVGPFTRGHPRDLNENKVRDHIAPVSLSIGKANWSIKTYIVPIKEKKRKKKIKEEKKKKRTKGNEKYITT